MEIYYLYDKDGLYFGDFPSHNGERPDTPNYSEIKPPDGLFKGKINGTKNGWIESMSQQEIDEIRNKPVPISETDEIKQQIADINLVLADMMGA